MNYMQIITLYSIANVIYLLIWDKFGFECTIDKISFDCRSGGFLNSFLCRHTHKVYVWDEKTMH